MILKLFPLALGALVLSGCATSSGGLYKTNVRETVTSTKTSQAFAVCVAEALSGDTQMRSDGDHHWVLRMNGYGVPVSRWDFWPVEGGGSRAELRATIAVNAGGGDVRKCA